MNVAGGIRFSARKYSEGTNGIAANTQIGLYNIEANTGNGFDFSSGVFTAPVAGIYQFGLSLLGDGDGNGYIVVVVLKNGYRERRFVGSGKSNARYNGITSSWEMILFKGNTVSLMLTSGHIYFQLMDYTDHLHFYGRLVAEKTAYRYS